MEIDTYGPETIGSKHNSQRLAEDARDAFDHLPSPDHDPAIVADEPEEDRAQASSATSATNEHSDVEVGTLISTIQCYLTIKFFRIDGRRGVSA